MQQNGVYDLLKMLEISLEEGFPIIPRKYTIVKTREIETLIDRIYASLPVEVQEARAFLRRKDELQIEAQQKADKIISDAQIEADRLLSESDLLRAVQREAEKIKEQVINDCEEIKRKALEEADAVRNQATDEALRMKDGASVYAEQILVGLEQNLNQLHQIVKDNQIQLERKRAEDEGQYSGYANQGKDYAQDFKM